MNINGLIASFRGESLLTEITGTNKKKGVTRPASQPRPKSLNKVMDALSIKGGLTRLLIQEKTELNLKCIDDCLKQFINEGVIKRSFLRLSGADKSYSYALVDDDSVPLNPEADFIALVYSEILKRKQVSRVELIAYLSSTAYRLNKALGVLIEEKKIIATQLSRRLGGIAWVYEAVK